MLESRALYANPKMQPSGTRQFTGRFSVYRRNLEPGHTPLDGEFGENVFKNMPVLSGWPGVIVPTTDDIRQYTPGETEISDYTLFCQFYKYGDGNLIIRRSDIIIDQNDANPNTNKYTVLFAHDPAQQGGVIIAGLRFGVVNANLGENV